MTAPSGGEASLLSAHRDFISQLSEPNGPLHERSPYATISDPAHFDRRQRSIGERRILHDEILREFVAAQPNVLQDRRAIILTGPPGAGKSSALLEAIRRSGADPSEYRVIDSDYFKDVLLERAVADGSLVAITPPEVTSAQAAGEQFYPRDFASLVHLESAVLARVARDKAIARGDRIVLDTVLGNPKAALARGRQLENAGYDVTIVEIEVSRSGSVERSRDRYDRALLDANKGEPQSQLGGRLVPASYIATLYPDGQQHSLCLDSAVALAREQPIVSRLELFRVDDPNVREPVPVATFTTELGPIGPQLDAWLSPSPIPEPESTRANAAFPSMASVPGSALTFAPPRFGPPVPPTQSPDHSR
ncbi:zeta toxin family protein [Microbacteriaceae bacterium VKM Ac-2854]|nr:zeta toxin family protein [Microbacteriaceae bacterium VKM Ac-2854]